MLATCVKVFAVSYFVIAYCKVVLSLCRFRFRPRVLQDVSKLNLRVQLQGEWVESPVGVAPTAMQKMAHKEGEVATAQGQTQSVPPFSFPLSPILPPKP